MGIFGGGYRYGYGNRGSNKLRLLIAAGFVIFGIITYVSRMERNPNTGELQAVAMNPEQEIRLGLASAPEMANQMGGAIDPKTNRDAQRVAAMGERLVEAWKARQSPYAQQFHFYLLNDSQTVNAFALPGGQIFITRALYDDLENEAQLAGVLGHEIGHVLHRHASEHMAKSDLGRQIVGAVAVGSGDYSSANVANMVNQMFQLKYGRKDELESDAWGLENMAAAGYDPAQMVRVMEILKKASGGSSGGIFATHPDPDQRIEVIKSYLAKRWPNGQSGLSSGAPLR